MESLQSHLYALAKGEEGELESFLGSLTNARFRLAGDIIGSDILTALTPGELWPLVIRLTRFNRKAFLGTVLKALATDEALADEVRERLRGSGGVLRQWAEGMTTLDRHKSLLALMPLANSPQELSTALEVFGQRGADIGRGHDIDYLIECGTPPAYFVLLGYMRVMEHDRNTLTAICRRLMQKADSLAFNAVSLYRIFFDLSDVRGTFSLHYEPYELGRMETDYDFFSVALRK